MLRFPDASLGAAGWVSLAVLWGLVAVCAAAVALRVRRWLFPPRRGVYVLVFDDSHVVDSSSLPHRIGEHA